MPSVVGYVACGLLPYINGVVVVTVAAAGCSSIKNEDFQFRGEKSLLFSALSPRDLSRVLGALVVARLMVEMVALNSRGLEWDLKHALIFTGEDWDNRCWRLSSEAEDQKHKQLLLPKAD